MLTSATVSSTRCQKPRRHCSPQHTPTKHTAKHPFTAHTRLKAP